MDQNGAQTEAFIIRMGADKHQGLFLLILTINLLIHSFPVCLADKIISQMNQSAEIVCINPLVPPLMEY